MKISVRFFPVVLVWVLSAHTADAAGLTIRPVDIEDLYRPVAGWSCKQASSCVEAVRAWCGGYRRADGDNDGIPCENVCRSRGEVNRIRQQVGC